MLRYQSTHIYARNLNLLSKFLKCHNLESQFCELLRPQTHPFQKIERNPLNLVTFRQAFLKIDLLKCLKITVVMLMNTSCV